MTEEEFEDLMNAQILSMDFWDNEIDEVWNDWIS